MAKCKDCTHYDLCLSHPTISYDCLDIEEQTRRWFKDKADVQEVKHAHWVPIISHFHGKPTGKYYCSNCRKVEKRRGFYCRDCGAKMDLED